jgi:hypothetical protein
MDLYFFKLYQTTLSYFIILCLKKKFIGVFFLKVNEEEFIKKEFFRSDYRCNEIKIILTRLGKENKKEKEESFEECNSK